jgi:hypothetical protein
MKPLLFAVSALALISMTASLATADGQFDRTLRVSGTVDLDVITDAGGIVVRSGSSDSVHVYAILKTQRGWFSTPGDEAHLRELERNPPIEQMGNRIRIGYVGDRTRLRGVSIHYEISTPPDTRLHARADSGGIRVQAIRGVVDCQTDSGGIDITNAGSDVRASADSGGIHIHGVTGSVVAHADSGGIDAIDVAGRIDAHTDSGGIRLSQSKAAPIREEADSGGVQVTLARGAGYNLDLASESGRILVPEMTSRGEISRHRVDGKVRGGGPSVHLSAQSGTVSVD